MILGRVAATTLVLVRHAHAQLPAIWHGATSDYTTGLTPQGWEQAHKLARELEAMPVRIYTSPFRRAVQTAHALWERFHIPLVVERALRERLIGAGPHSNQEMDAAHERSFREPTYRLPGGETLLEAQQRFTSGLKRITEANPSQEVLVIAHGTVLTLFMSSVRSRPPTLEYLRSIPNAGYARVLSDGQQYRIMKDFAD